MNGGVFGLAQEYRRQNRLRLHDEEPDRHLACRSVDSFIGEQQQQQPGSSQLIVDSFVGLFSHTAPRLWRARVCRLER